MEQVWRVRVQTRLGEHESRLVADPDMPGLRRYFDGEDFTKHVARMEPRLSVWVGARMVALGMLMAVGVLLVLFGAWVLAFGPEPDNCVEQKFEVDVGTRFTMDSSCR